MTIKATSTALCLMMMLSHAGQCLANPAHATSTNNVTQLLPPFGKEYRAYQDPIQIRLGSDIPAIKWPHLHLEIDNIDVTELINLSQNVISYAPQELFTPGTHQLRLVAVLPDGSIEELADWQIETRASATFVESEIESNLDLQVIQRVADNYDAETAATISKTQGQGSYQFQSLQSTSNVRLTNRADVIYNSQRNQTQNGRKLDLNEFNLSSEWSQSSVSLGHHSIPANSLVLTDFNRRGLSASFNNESKTFSATGFAMRTEVITGFENGLGIGDHNNRTDGLAITASPFSSAPEKLIVSLAHLDGQGTNETIAITDVENPEETEAELTDSTPDTAGDASSISLESYLLKNQLYMRGEYARSRFDFDGKNSGLAAEDDRASSLYAQFSTERDSNRSADDNWHIGLSHQRIGTWFHSLGNTFLPSDKETTQFQSGYLSPQWQLGFIVGNEKDNVVDDLTIPDTEIQLVNTVLTFTPQSGPIAINEGIFSHPVLSLGYTQNTQKIVRTPVGYTGDDINLVNQEFSLGLDFTGDNWNWRISHSLTDEEDKTNLNSDSKNRLTSLEVFIPISDNFTLSPILQSSRNNNIDTGVITDGWNSAFSLNYDNQDNWNSSLTYTVARDKANDGSVNSRSSLIDLLVNWVYLQAQPNKPGLSLFASASLQDTQTIDIETNTDQYQYFIGINMSWPVVF